MLIHIFGGLKLAIAMIVPVAVVLYCHHRVTHFSAVPSDDATQRPPVRTPSSHH